MHFSVWEWKFCEGLNNGIKLCHSLLEFRRILLCKIMEDNMETECKWEFQKENINEHFFQVKFPGVSFSGSHTESGTDEHWSHFNRNADSETRVRSLNVLLVKYYILKYWKRRGLYNSAMSQSWWLVIKGQWPRDGKKQEATMGRFSATVVYSKTTPVWNAVAKFTDQGRSSGPLTDKEKK